MPDAEDMMIEVKARDLSSLQYALSAARDALAKQDVANAAMNLADVRPRPLTTLVRDAEQLALSYFPREQQQRRSAFLPGDGQ